MNAQEAQVYLQTLSYNRFSDILEEKRDQKKLKLMNNLPKK